jgi:hypothetical protein
MYWARSYPHEDRLALGSPRNIMLPVVPLSTGPVAHPINNGNKANALRIIFDHYFRSMFAMIPSL